MPALVAACTEAREAELMRAQAEVFTRVLGVACIEVQKAACTQVREADYIAALAAACIEDRAVGSIEGPVVGCIGGPAVASIAVPPRILTQTIGLHEKDFSKSS